MTTLLLDYITNFKLRFTLKQRINYATADILGLFWCCLIQFKVVPGNIIRPKKGLESCKWYQSQPAIRSCAGERESPGQSPSGVKMLG